MKNDVPFLFSPFFLLLASFSLFSFLAEAVSLSFLFASWCQCLLIPPMIRQSYVSGLAIWLCFLLVPQAEQQSSLPALTRMLLNMNQNGRCNLILTADFFFFLALHLHVRLLHQRVTDVCARLPLTPMREALTWAKTSSNSKKKKKQKERKWRLGFCCSFSPSWQRFCLSFSSASSSRWKMKGHWSESHTQIEARGRIRYSFPDPFAVWITFISFLLPMLLFPFLFTSFWFLSHPSFLPYSQDDGYCLSSAAASVGQYKSSQRVLFPSLTRRRPPRLQRKPCGAWCVIKHEDRKR